MRLYDKEKKSKLLKIFLIISFVLILTAIINFLSNYFLNSPFLYIGLRLDGFIRISMLIFSIYCLIQFHKQKLSKLTFVIPIWVIAVSVLSIILGIILAFLLLTRGISPDIVLNSSIYEMFGFISNLFGFFFISYLFFILRK